MTSRAPGQWWGAYELEPDAVGRFRIGPLELWVQRARWEWRLAHRQDRDPLESSLEVELPSAAPTLDATLTVSRLAGSSNERDLHLVPVLADRAIVARPEQPISVLAHETVTMYASTPVWVRLLAGSARTKLGEIPAHRPKDTWFGESTTAGELCYGTKTAGRLELKELPTRPHRAVTAVVIKNRLLSPLLIERIRIPMPQLSLFAAQGRLWTEEVTLERSEDERASVYFSNRAPAIAGETERLSEARERSTPGLLVRAFGSLFRD